MTKVAINPKVQEELQELINTLDMPTGKAARILSKAIGKDNKLNRFLASKVDQGYSFFTDKKRRDKILDNIQSAFGFTDVKGKQALIIKILTGEVESEVNAKRVELTKGLDLTEEQKAQLVKKLAEYRNFIAKDLQTAALELALEFGVADEVKEVKPAVAPAPALAEAE